MPFEIALHVTGVFAVSSAGLYALGKLFILLRDVLVARMVLKCENAEKVRAYAEVVAAQSKQPESSHRVRSPRSVVSRSAMPPTDPASAPHGFSVPSE
jgi:hypothetical protein